MLRLKDASRAFVYLPVAAKALPTKSQPARDRAGGDSSETEAMHRANRREDNSRSDCPPPAHSELATSHRAAAEPVDKAAPLSTPRTASGWLLFDGEGMWARLCRCRLAANRRQDGSNGACRACSCRSGLDRDRGRRRPNGETHSPPRSAWRTGLTVAAWRALWACGAGRRQPLRAGA